MIRILAILCLALFCAAPANAQRRTPVRNLLAAAKDRVTERVTMFRATVRETVTATRGCGCEGACGVGCSCASATPTAVAPATSIPLPSLVSEGKPYTLTFTQRVCENGVCREVPYTVTFQPMPTPKKKKK